MLPAWLTCLPTCLHELPTMLQVAIVGYARPPHALALAHYHETASGGPLLHSSSITAAGGVIHNQTAADELRQMLLSMQGQLKALETSLPSTIHEQLKTYHAANPQQQPQQQQQLQQQPQQQPVITHQQPVRGVAVSNFTATSIRP